MKGTEHGCRDQPFGREAAGTEPRAFGRRISTETKAAYKTTEFAVYVVVFVGILLVSFLVKTGQDGQRPDYFRADKAWWYITLLTIGRAPAGTWSQPGRENTADSASLPIGGVH
jgi:hypothetical protein